MALIMPHSIFYHIPKTGGSFIVDVLSFIIPNARRYEKPKIDVLNLQKQHITPDDVDEETRKNKFQFAFVREPVAWYKSIWYQQMEDGWNVKGYVISQLCRSEHFDEFVANCLTLYPKGIVSEIYKRFLGEDLEKVNFVGRQERLRDDLCYALDQAEAGYDRNKVYEWPLINVSKKKAMLPYLAPGLKRKIVVAEEWFYERFLTYD